MAAGQSLEKSFRDYYLQALGVVQYVSKDLVDDIRVDSQESTKSAPVASQQAAAESLLKVDLEVKPNKRTAKVLSANIIAEETAALALKFAFWQPTDELLIATAATQELPNSQQVNLLKNIVKAIDSQSSGLPQFDVVNWPPHASMQGGETEAREFLSTLISSKLAAKPTKILLLLGDSAKHWLLSSSQKTEIIDGLVPLSDKVMGLMVPSLATMLSEPKTKPVTWHVICKYLNQYNVSS